MRARLVLVLFLACAVSGVRAQMPAPEVVTAPNATPEAEPAQPPAVALQWLQTPPADPARSDAGAFAWFGGAAVRPYFSSAFRDGPGQWRPWTGVAQLQLGYRRENGASWLVNFEYEPVRLFDGDPMYPLLYLDFDRLSSNRSLLANTDIRCLFGVRLYDFGIGPHVGVVSRWSPMSPVWGITSKLDVGYLYPITLHGRAELGIEVKLAEYAPGLSFATGVMSEATWLIFVGGVGPGNYARLNWRF